jgi:L-alanine-DL-glutamate epimerase-like enolase superfamily enzyme
LYGSGGFTSYSIEELWRQLGGWVADGITRVKMKVGRDAAQDLHRVEAAREAIGSTAELFVDANGAYARQQALAQARMLDAGAVDILQADATRCGGITGFVRVAALCEAAGIPLSAHPAPSLHAHACCALAPAIHVEYFFDHARIEDMLFDGALTPRGGALEPDRSRPGCGLELNRAGAARYAA